MNMDSDECSCGSCFQHSVFNIYAQQKYFQYVYYHYGNNIYGLMQHRVVTSKNLHAGMESHAEITVYPVQCMGVPTYHMMLIQNYLSCIK